MIVVTLIPLAVCIVGALVYALATNAKLAEMGRLAFFAGLLVFCFAVMGQQLRIG